MLIDTRRDRIAKLRAVGGAGDAVGARLAIERALAGVELQPRSFPASAILCVRRLRMGTPLRDARPWAGRLDNQLQQLASASTRPFRESVPANAPAVVFHDEAELLACLARDWRRGDGDAWWWRGLFHESASQTLVERVFIELPQYVPAAIELLTDMGIVGDVFGGLPAAFCIRLGSIVSTTFAVAEWNQAVRSPTTIDAAVASASVSDASPNGSRFAPVLRALVVPRDVGTLPAEHRALIAVALTLRQAPAAARAPGFADALRDYVWQVESTVELIEHHVDADSPAPDRRVIGIERRSAREDPSNIGERSDADASTVVEPPFSGAKKSTADNVLDRHGEVQGERATPASASQNTTPAIPSTDASLKIVDRDKVTSPRADQRGVSYALPYAASEFAGVVYLINLALHLELYGDFTQPLRPGIALPLGDFLALVGEYACGPSIRDDVVWTICARLAGRGDNEEPKRPRDLSELITTLARRTSRSLDQPEESALTFLCARHGRIAFTATRLDVAFSLAEHPLAIRMSGLDRNPGWVPTAGRIVELHYE